MSVIIADGHSVVRFGLEMLLNSADIEVMTVCADGEKTLALVREGGTNGMPSYERPVTPRRLSKDGPLLIVL